MKNEKTDRQRERRKDQKMIYRLNSTKIVRKESLK